MIGLIITGQGNFASGLSKALCAISGVPEKYIAIDYTEEESPVRLESRLQQAMKDLGNCPGILILTDLAGGIPYKTSVEVGYPKGCEVVAGTNLGMLVEMNAARSYIDDVHELARQAVTVGKDQVERFVFHPSASHPFQRRENN